MANGSGRGKGPKSNEDQKPTVGAGEDKKVENAPEVPLTPVALEVPNEHEMASPEEQAEVAVEVKEKKYKIILMEQDNNDKNQDQLVTDPSNMKQYLIKRGFEVEVPIGVVNNLKESIQPKLSYDDDGNEVWRDVPRFAIQFNGEA
jgi:hypothetical protein